MGRADLCRIAAAEPPRPLCALCVSARTKTAPFRSRCDQDVNPSPTPKSRRAEIVLTMRVDADTMADGMVDGVADSMMGTVTNGAANTAPDTMHADAAD